MAELCLDQIHPQLINRDRLALNNILHYYNNYYVLLSKVVSILDSFVPKEIAGRGGCNISVSHDVDSRIVTVLYGEIIEEEPQLTVESLEGNSTPEGWISEDEQCEEVSQDVANDVIEEIFDSELIIAPCGEMVEITMKGDVQNIREEEVHYQSCIENDENSGKNFMCNSDLAVQDRPSVTDRMSQGEECPDFKYICQYVDCPKRFFRAKEYSIHQEKAHPWLLENVIAVRCKYIHCQTRFNSIHLLHAHHATHRSKPVTRTNGFSSEVDNVGFKNSSQQKKPAPDRPVRMRKCEFCDTVMDCKVNVYSQHCLQEHDRSPYACPMCMAPFHLQSHLSEHMKTEHSQEEVEIFIMQDLWREFAVHDGVRMAECRFCYRIIYSYMSRTNHAEQHRKEMRRNCAHCGGKHNETFCSHPKPKFDAKLEKLHCVQCNKWMSKKNFKEHLVTHTKERNFPCTVCKKTFKVRRTATRHIQNHINANNRKRKCYDCAAVFADETEIPEHYREKHPTLQPYQCAICSEGFHVKALLVDHCHTHSDDERRMVSIKTPLASYQVGSARVFECTLCRRAFSTKRSTIAHLIVHTDRPFVCPQCNLSFRMETMLAMHMVDMHHTKDVAISL